MSTTATASPAAPVTNITEAPTTPAATPANPDQVAATPAKAPEAPKPTVAEIRKLKLKLDGQDLDLPEEEVIRLAQQAGSSQRKFQEAAAIRKQAEQVIEMMKANPAEVMKQLGIDPRKFSEEHLMEALKREQESPEQKESRELKEKVRKYEAKEKEIEESNKKKAADEAEAKAKREHSEKENAIRSKYEAMFIDALSKSGLPKTPYTVARMATLQRINLKAGFDLGADKLAELVKQDYDSEFQSRLPKSEKGDLDGEKLLDLLGPDIVKALTKAQIAKLKGKQKFSAPTEQAPESPQKESGLTWRQFQQKSRMSKT